MSLDMLGAVDDVFQSVGATRYAQGGDRDAKGRWVDGAESSSSHTVNIQPLSDREISNIQEGAERIQDFRKVYVNDGDLYSLTPQDEWEFDDISMDGRYTVYMMDNRPWRNYCKLVVHRNDR